MKDFKQLRVWSEAHDLTLRVYVLTRSFPREEMYGLTSQMRRAAASIPAKVAEGCGRRSDGELTRFLQIARGSASELEYHLMLSRDLRFLDADQFDGLQHKLVDVERMLTALVQRVQPPNRSREGYNERRKEDCQQPVARS